MIDGWNIHLDAGRAPGKHTLCGALIHAFCMAPLWFGFFLTGRFLVGDIGRPLSGGGYGQAPFWLRIPTRRNRRFHVGHQRVFGGGLALLVFANVVTVLYKKCAGLGG